ncbi:uncharacterized protein LOC135681285 isoform X1 [Rhopilema esculentum]|uniref:uncharacterized protein LOC135681285 isoform X1 n=1 Tax=Rhopilema esculentum TaxID=499914 RepID=UPI0031CFF6A8
MEEALRMFLALNSLLSVNGRILRIPCMIDAVFDVVFFDKRLQGNGLAVFNSIDDQGCTLKCAENHKCTSYNYQWMDKTCEIHQKHVQQDNSTDLLDANGWIFKTTNYSNKLIGPTCNSLKPCDPEDLCLDTCSPPFYECIHCQSLYPELKCIKQADVDACASNPCKHASQCLNKSSDYECTCLEGYTGKICDIDIDECASLPCFNGGTCSNQIGNFVCQCFQGYTGIHCEQDIDECLDGAHQCHTKAYCKNTFGSLYCECWAGYSGDGIKSCIDVNECLVSTHNCHTNADCTNTDGSFNCNCQTGYSGNGVTCADINECTDGTHNCHADALCTNTVGSFYCTCNDGYAGSGIACSDIDECTTGVHGCPLGTQCINKAGMFICTVNMAYKKPSQQSSIDHDGGIDLVSEFGNDGNRNGAWQVCAITLDSKPWWQVDLVNRVNVGMVIIRSGTTWEQLKINPFSISVGDDSTDGGRLNPLCVSNQNVESGKMKEMHCGQPLLGRYVSVFIDRKEQLQVCELEVYEVNMAYKKPSQQSSLHIYSGINLVSEFGNDGNRDGDWSVCAVTTTYPQPWWQVDLVNRVHVGTVIIRSGTTWGQTKINPFSISVGNDSTNGGRLNPLCVSNQNVESGKMKEMHCGQPLLGRYVSVFIDRGENLQVCELEVYQANMAYKKPSKKSSQHIVFGIDLVSEFGNDGNRNGAWEVCAFTATSPPPWWQVDLVNRVHIGMVIIRSGTTFGQWKINPFSISVGDDETNGGRSNPLCVSDQTVVSGEVKEMHCGQPLLGRYVSVFIDREENLQVCELEVYQGVSLANKISCVDWYRVGAKNNGIYAISDKTGLIHHVYCDFSSEPNFVWTLVTSFSLANNYLFKNKPLYENDPISEYEPNWNSYRLGFSVMDYVSSVSTHWRATCSYPGYGVDYRDYVRAKLSEINPLTYKDSICKLVELINIRGHNATNQWVSFWQDTELFLHTDSDLNHCFLLAKEGSVASEDNFGYHETINKDFSCTEASTSTTQYWFGVSV